MRTCGSLALPHRDRCSFLLLQACRALPKAMADRVMAGRDGGDKSICPCHRGGATSGRASPSGPHSDTEGARRAKCTCYLRSCLSTSLSTDPYVLYRNHGYPAVALRIGRHVPPLRGTAAACWRGNSRAALRRIPCMPVQHLRRHCIVARTQRGTGVDRGRAFRGGLLRASEVVVREDVPVLVSSVGWDSRVRNPSRQHTGAS